MKRWKNPGRIESVRDFFIFFYMSMIAISVENAVWWIKPKRKNRLSIENTRLRRLSKFWQRARDSNPRGLRLTRVPGELLSHSVNPLYPFGETSLRTFIIITQFRIFAREKWNILKNFLTFFPTASATAFLNHVRADLRRNGKRNRNDSDKIGRRRA